MRTCEYVIEGNPEGPTVVFIHGWPDDASLWRLQVAALAGEFRCVLVTLPNFGARSVRAGGFGFPELIDMLVATIREVQPEGQVRLVTHDWGAYIGYMLEQAHPELIERIVAFDVGGHMGKTGPRTALMIVGYQWALIACWLIGGVVPPLGNLLTRGVGRVVGVPSRQRATIRSRCNYAYFSLWKGMLLPWKRDSILSRYRPRCAVFFLFGARKPLMFHSARWLQTVTESGGESEGLAGAGHWLMETHSEAVNARLLAWLKKSPEAV